MNKDELYFCLHLTESEHYIVEDQIKNFCVNNDLTLKYYRKFKNGHIPMYREIKVIGKNLGIFKKFLKDNLISDYIKGIPDSARITPEEGKREWDLIKETLKESNPILYRAMENQYKNIQ